MVTIQGVSMQPIFQSGDRVLVRRTPVSTIHQGAIVVFEQSIAGFLPGEEFLRELGAGRGGHELGREWIIKRAVAVPGTRVPQELTAALGEHPGARVPPGHLVVLGDNLNHSYDSRQCGYIT